MSKASDRYVKLVAWSEEDQCYIGRCPGLMFGGVHGSACLALPCLPEARKVRQRQVDALG